MNSNVKRIVVSAALVAAASATAAILSTSATGTGIRQGGPSSSTVHQTWTPNDCIRLNHGDFNACNVGNSGRGDLPYQPVTQSAQFRSN